MSDTLSARLSAEEVAGDADPEVGGEAQALDVDPFVVSVERFENLFCLSLGSTFFLSFPFR